MVGKGPPYEHPYGRRPVHLRHGLDRRTKARLTELGRHLPPPSEEVARIIAADRAGQLRRRLVIGVVVVVVLAVGVGGMVQWYRPLPPPTLRGLAAALRTPGTAPALPWPPAGEAALDVPGIGSLGRVGGTRPVPVGVLSGVLAAYVILKDHPLPTGTATGPPIAVTPGTLAAYQAGSAAGEPEVPVSPGESLTELAALEGLLVDSGNDMATLLAGWDAGSTSAFVTKMAAAAASLGLGHTRVTAPGGADDAVVSTPSDLIRLAQAAMRIPLFGQIVSLGQVTLPEAGLHYNLNSLLGTNGVVGIEAGSDTTANGCYLFAAQKTVGGRTVTLYGAVLGQSGPIGPTAAAVGAGSQLMTAALSDLVGAPILQAGRAIGHLSYPWGASTTVTVSRTVTIPAWPGRRVPVKARLARLTVPVAARARVGWLQVRQGSRLIEVALHAAAPLRGPSGLWRLTR